MAEGGMDYDNPTFDRDDIDDNYPMVPDEPVQRHIDEFNDSIDKLRGEVRQSELEQQKQRLVKLFYDEVAKRYNITPETLGYNQFRLSDDGKTLFWIVGDKEFEINAKQGGGTFLSLGSLAKMFGKGGTRAIRQYLNLPEYQSKTRIASSKAVAALEKARDDVSTMVEEIPLTDITNETEGQELLDNLDFDDDSFLALFNDPLSSTTSTQTEIDKREMDGIANAMTNVKEELANNLAKLAAVDKDISKEKQKLGQTEDETQVKTINDRITDLESERSARLEVINTNKDALRTQVNRIKETINKMLREDTTLGEKIRTLFREQGITIVSILTALGMIIGVIVETIIPGGGGSTTPPPPPKSSGVRDWVKKQLSNLGKLLANLAGKAASALPGVIGSIVSWLLSATGKVVNWFADNLWALVVSAGGLIYVAAKGWISKT